MSLPYFDKALNCAPVAHLDRASSCDPDTIPQPAVERAQVRRSELEFEGELDGAGAADSGEGLKPPLAPSDPGCSPGFVQSTQRRYHQL